MCVVCDFEARPPRSFDCIHADGGTSNGNSSQTADTSISLNSAPLSEPELQDRIDTLLQADDFGLSTWDNGQPVTFTYGFDTVQPGNFLWQSDEPTGFVAFTEAQKDAIRAALAEYSHFFNITFVEDNVAAQTDMSFFRANDLYADTPNSGGGGRGRWRYDWNGSEYYWTGQAAFNSNRDIARASDFDLILHEIGHMLGLKHPGNYDVGGNNPPGPFLPANEDNDR